MKGNKLLKTGKYIDLYGIPFSYIFINVIFLSQINQIFILNYKASFLLVKFSCKHNKTNW